jgi:hypothetical protein
MGDTVNLPIALDSDLGRKLVSDLARFSEGICSELEVRKRHHFDDATWEALGDNEALLAEVDAEKLRRIRNGMAKTEKAQILVIKAPEVVSGIMLDSTQNARHRIDAAKVLDSFADSGPKDGPAAAEMFLIKIDISGGSGDPAEVYERTVTLTKPLSSGEPGSDVDTTQQQKMIEAKKESDDDGEPV